MYIGKKLYKEAESTEDGFDGEYKIYGDGWTFKAFMIKNELNGKCIMTYDNGKIIHGEFKKHRPMNL